MRRPLSILAVLMALPVILLAAPGEIVSSFPTPYECTQGLTFDGSHLWSIDRKSDMIYKINPADGAVIDSIVTPGYIPRGLTWDGSRLWCVDGENEQICAINPETRIVERTIWCPVSKPTGMAWDGTYLWIADDAENELHQISPDDGTTILTLRAPSSTPCGLTYDGEYLWVSDRITNMIYMVTPDEGDVIVCFAAPGPHSWGLTWDGANLWNADYQTDLIYQLVVDDGTPFTRLKTKSEQVELIHQVRNFGPDTVTSLDVYLAIPHDRDNQQLRGDPIFDPEPTEIIADKWGQKVAHFAFADIGATSTTEVSMLARADLYQVRYFIFPDKVGGLGDIPQDIKKLYLVDDTKFSTGSSVIQTAVDQAVGDETNPYWIARRIYNFVIDNMFYELAGGWNIAPTVLDRGNGSCSEYSFVYISMCRAAGLPARYVGSLVVRGDDASYDDVFHRWVEVYLPNYGWIPIDPSGGDSDVPANRANSFGYLNNRYLITTIGGGGSEYLEWSYNANERWTSKGRCKISVENIGEWTPLTENDGHSQSGSGGGNNCAGK